MPKQPSAPRSPEPGFRPSDEPSARSISSSRADEVATDERATDTGTKAAHVATTNVPAIARDRGPTARPRSAPDLWDPIASRRCSKRHSPAKKVAWLSCRFSFSCIEKIHVRTRDRRKIAFFRATGLLSVSIPGARWRGKHGFRAKGKNRTTRAKLANFRFSESE